MPAKRIYFKFNHIFCSVILRNVNLFQEPECNSLKEEENTDNMEYVIEVDPFPVISPLRGETISSEPADVIIII